MVHKELESETGAPAEATLQKDPQHSPVKEKEPFNTTNHQKELENIRQFMGDLVNSLANSMSSELSIIRNKLQEHEKTVNSLMNDIFENSTTQLFSEKSPVPSSVETPFNLVKKGHKSKQLQNRQNITQLANRFEVLANEDNYSTTTNTRIIPGQKTYSETVTHQSLNQHPPAKVQPNSQQSQPHSRQIYPQPPAAQQTSHQTQSLQNLQPPNVNQHPPSVVQPNSQQSQPHSRQIYPQPPAAQQTSHQTQSLQNLQPPNVNQHPPSVVQANSQHSQSHPRQNYPQPPASQQTSHQFHSLQNLQPPNSSPLLKHHQSQSQPEFHPPQQFNTQQNHYHQQLIQNQQPQIENQQKQTQSFHQQQPKQSQIDQPSRSQNQENSENTLLIIGDSNIHGVKPRELAQRIRERVFVHKQAISGATASHICHYSDILLKDKPNAVIIHAGTNDLVGRNADSNLSADNIACDLIRTGVKARNAGVKQVMISSLLPINDYQANKKAQEVNNHLREHCHAYNFLYIDNANMTKEDLQDTVHLSRDGKGVLMDNFAYYVNRY